MQDQSESNPLLPVYRRCTTLMERGEGVYLYDDIGKEYLDFASGIATNALGHRHPVMVDVLKKQADRLWHCSNLFRNQPLEDFATLLCEHSFAEKIFFCSSGTEAVEAAIKTIRRFHYVNGETHRSEIISANGAFHGRTTGALSACTNEKSKEGCEPLLPDFIATAFDDIDALRACITDKTAAIILETIQGEGGIRSHNTEYLRDVRALCDTHGVLLFLDEIQCGYGRTGTLFAFERAGITPDICTVAKGIGGGFPLAAMLATNHAAMGMTQGTHGSTYGSNPLACAVGHAILTEILSSGFLEHVEKSGATLLTRLRNIVADFPNIFAQARGEGLLLGIELQPDIDKHALNAQFRANGLLLAPAVTHVIRVLPPLIIDDAHIDQAEHIIRNTCKGW